MRTIFKLGAPMVAAALALTACGGTTNSSDSADAPKEVKIGFYGALTGPAANLGQNIKKGAQLAVDQYNASSPKTKVTLVDYDSQGDPNAANALAKKAAAEKDVIGIVGPAFSGESKNADPVFAEVGLTAITASATNPKLAENGWKTFFRVLGNDNSQGPAAAKYIQNVMQAKKVVVVDDASEYGKGLADIVKKDLGSTVVDSDTIQTGQTNFSPTVTKIKSAKADAVFFGGYYAEGSLLKKQMTDAGLSTVLVVGDGVKDEGFIKGAGAKAAEGTVMTCPCLPPDKVTGSFFSDYKTKFGTEPATYGAEAYDAASILLAAVKAGKTSRSDVLDFVKGYDADGVTKHLKFTDTGESAEVTVWAYKVKNGVIVPDQEIK